MKIFFSLVEHGIFRSPSFLLVICLLPVLHMKCLNCFCKSVIYWFMYVSVLKLHLLPKLYIRFLVLESSCFVCYFAAKWHLLVPSCLFHLFIVKPLFLYFRLLRDSCNSIKIHYPYLNLAIGIKNTLCTNDAEFTLVWDQFCEITEIHYGIKKLHTATEV